MQLADMLVVTGSQSNVRSAYSSGTPAIGVGMGNVVTIIDETADLDDAAQKIQRQNVLTMQHHARRKTLWSLLTLFMMIALPRFNALVVCFWTRHKQSI